jgi:hypothetical protein
VRDIVDNDAGPTRAARFCRVVATALRDRCFYGIGTIVADLSPKRTDHRAACEALTREHHPECLMERAA